ncbi:MAG: ATP-binding cassette domain-containing protein, partial [Myxococcota bacterium]
MSADLKSLVRIWHPRYRRALIGLLAIGTLVSVSIYAENTLLQGLVQSLSAGGSGEQGFMGRAFGSISGPVKAPLLFLMAIFLVGIIRSFLNARSYVAGSKLVIVARDDLEHAVLSELLHRDDSFYSQHSTGEIISRIQLDLGRVLDRRDSFVTACWAFLSIFSNLFFFSMNDWRLGLVVLVICILGTLYSEHVSKPVKAADNAYYLSNDLVKTDFEDYLKAIPEIQTGHLYANILGRFKRPQESRFKAFMDWVLSYARVEFSRNAWPAAAFLIASLIVLSVQGGGTSRGLSLIPVLIYALPAIFSDVTRLVTLRINFQLSGNSVNRILEYQSAEPAPGIPVKHRAEAASPSDTTAPFMTMENASFRYTSPGGGTQGGVHGVTTSFSTGRWAAIIGGAGAGKSTLINLLLGRLVPQEGTIRINHPGAASGDRTGVATLMPQKIVLLDTTIRDNLLLGVGGGGEEAGLEEGGNIALLEEIGLGDVCRLKALDMRPVAGSRALSGEDVAELRRQSRIGARNIGIGLAFFEEAGVDLRRIAVDALIGGRSDLAATLGVLLHGDRPEWLLHLARSGLGEELAGQGRLVIERTCNLLGRPDYAMFLEISPEKHDETVWSLRRACLPFYGRKVLADVEQIQMIRVGLTSFPSEWGQSLKTGGDLIALRQRFQAEIETIRGVVRSGWQPFDSSLIHPYLDWRGNILFAGAETANNRQRRELDLMLVHLMARDPWRDYFIEQGLQFHVGRNGSRLSGGQGQLVALGRAVMRRTPLLVLDEPTSALDPESRDRVGAFLRRWKEGRAVITISHDPELVRHADEIQVIS